MRADIVLVKVGPPLEWRMYRDVFEVDGRPVRDRAERLAALFLEPAETARAQAERIAEVSARFNISNLGRVLNEPGLPLAFLQTSLQPRFRFTLDRRDRGNRLERPVHRTGSPYALLAQSDDREPERGPVLD